MTADRAMRAAEAEDTAGPRGVPSFGELDRSASFLLRIAQLASYEAVFAADPDMPLTLPEVTVLSAIEANPEARQGEIADALRIKWPHMTKLVRGLESRGLVERYVPEGDRRSLFLRLTAAGIALRDEMAPRMRAVDEAAMAMLSAGERAQLLALLRKVAGWEPPAEAR
jgi:DNA-binding MarR family transcriptional regulator